MAPGDRSHSQRLAGARAEQIAQQPQHLVVRDVRHDHQVQKPVVHQCLLAQSEATPRLPAIADGEDIGVSLPRKIGAVT